MNKTCYNKAMTIMPGISQPRRIAKPLKQSLDKDNDTN